RSTATSDEQTFYKRHPSSNSTPSSRDDRPSGSSRFLLDGNIRGLAMIRTETSVMLKSLNGSGSSNVNRVRINLRALLAVPIQPRFDAIHARHLHIEVHTVRVRS